MSKEDLNCGNGDFLPLQVGNSNKRDHSERSHDGTTSSKVSIHSQTMQWGQLHRKRGSDPSIDLSMPRYMKSTPADPQVSDITSVSMIANDPANDSINDLKAVAISTNTVTPIGSPLKNRDIRSLSETNSSFFDNIMSSFNFNKLTKDSEIDENSDVSSTGFIYASPTDNRDFHTLFKLIPVQEKLIRVLDCNLNRNYPYKGKLYATEDHLCFNSTVLDWLAQIQIPVREIRSLTKNSQDSMHNDEICVETSLGMTRFNGFQNLEAAFQILMKIMNNNKKKEVKPLFEKGVNKRGTDLLNYSIGLNPPVTQKSSIVAGAETNPIGKSSINLLTSLEATNNIRNDDEDIEDIIRSIDETSSTSSAMSVEGDDDDESVLADIKVPIYKLNDKASNFSVMDYTGPFYNNSKHTTKIPTRSVDEYSLADIELSCPPGMLFDFLFNETKPTFLQEFLTKQDSSNFTDIGKFEINDSGLKTREYSYQKQLHFPVGPSTTKCNVEEQIVHYDVNDYIELINTTRTPNVPSGTNFSTKTRYIIQWHESTRCKLRLSFWVEWTGSSWIKNMVESSCKSGLISSTIDFINLIENFVEKHTIVDYMMVDKTISTSKSKENSPWISNTSTTNLEESVATSQNNEPTRVPKSIFTNPSAVMVLFSINIMLFLMLLYALWSINSKMNKLIEFQLYSTDGINTTPDTLFETPVRNDILKSHNQQHISLQSLRSLLGITPNSQRIKDSSELSGKILDKLMKLLASHEVDE
ncbi:similar to Saccharomyces cerevisiae YFL042C Putative protein of unknown function [Maudiozyma saulgeensis]|uniref:VASt domain-containing protein n=1 Tax=Maudiozyma saulgeensis TaxID=1789683 RepID=A0A1X7R3F8_9SACH|nr:similar to Saccharomyces cerevisiae YFL042C Putative protein of unknown function [Kazachstania saulgeensis]